MYVLYTFILYIYIYYIYIQRTCNLIGEKPLISIKLEQTAQDEDGGVGAEEHRDDLPP